MKTSFPNPERWTPSPTNIQSSSQDISGYLIYPPPNLQHKYAAKLFIRLAAKFNALLSLLHNQVLRGKICDHTIFVFGNDF